MTYNEAHQIREVLESIKWADEILLVDSFSTDGTVEIGKEFGAKIISEKFCGFGKLRNFAVDGSANDWMLSIDSDERCIQSWRRRSEERCRLQPLTRIWCRVKIIFSDGGFEGAGGIRITGSRNSLTARRCAIVRIWCMRGTN